MVYVSEDAPYMKLLKPFLEKKKASAWPICDAETCTNGEQRLAADSWGNDESQIRHIFEPIEQWLLKEVPGIRERYPKLQKQPKRSLARLLREMLLSVRPSLNLFMPESDESSRKSWCTSMGRISRANLKTS